MAHMIAEIGSNHLSKLDLAFAHIEAAAHAGADAVKFQYFRAKTDLAPRPIGALALAYDQYVGAQALGALVASELPDSWLPSLDSCAKQNGVELLFSCSDVSGLDVISRISTSVKVASCDIDNIELLARIKQLFQRVIMSTGAADWATIRNAREYLVAGRDLELSLLYCVAEYPMPLERFDPNAMRLLRKLHGDDVGYSDHAEGWQASAWALTLGASVLERHFVLDRDIVSPDACVSSTPDEFREIVEFSRAMERAATPTPDRVSDAFDVHVVKRGMRRSPVAKADLPSGTTISYDDVMYLRPAIGLDPFLFMKEYVGRTLVRDVAIGEFIQTSDFG